MRKVEWKGTREELMRRLWESNAETRASDDKFDQDGEEAWREYRDYINYQPAYGHHVRLAKAAFFAGRESGREDGFVAGFTVQTELDEEVARRMQDEDDRVFTATTPWDAMGELESRKITANIPDDELVAFLEELRPGSVEYSEPLGARFDAGYVGEHLVISVDPRYPVDGGFVSLPREQQVLLHQMIAAHLSVADDSE